MELGTFVVTTLTLIVTLIILFYTIWKDWIKSKEEGKYEFKIYDVILIREKREDNNLHKFQVFVENNSRHVITLKMASMTFIKNDPVPLCVGLHLSKQSRALFPYYLPVEEGYHEITLVFIMPEDDDIKYYNCYKLCLYSAHHKQPVCCEKYF